MGRLFNSVIGAAAHRQRHPVAKSALWNAANLLPQCNTGPAPLPPQHFLYFLPEPQGQG